MENGGETKRIQQKEYLIKRNQLLSTLRLVLEDDIDVNLKITGEVSKQLLSKMFHEALTFAHYMEELPENELDMFFSTLSHVVRRSDDEGVYFALNEKQGFIGRALRKMLESKNYALDGIFICWDIYDSFYEDEELGRSWSNKFLEEFGLFDQIQNIADSDQNGREDFWDWDTIQEARKLFPRDEIPEQ